MGIDGLRMQKRTRKCHGDSSSSAQRLFLELEEQNLRKLKLLKLRGF